MEPVALRSVILLIITLAIFKGFEATKYIGCYKEISHQSRLFAGAQQNFKNTLTPNKCISFCKGKSFLYAGLQYSYECFCSNDRPSFIHSADESDCNNKCDGDQLQMCGGGNRLSVYDIENKHVNFVQTNYIGCYADTGTGGRALTGKRGPDSNSMTPESCVGFCFRDGYRFAATQYQKECFCGEEVVGKKASEGECDMECAGDSRFLCGGGFRNSVYHTSIPDESEDGKVLGCFEDSSEFRLLSGFRIDLAETNSPKKCMNICKQLGYKYAGVQYSIECHCGNRKPEKEKERRENECLAACPSGIRNCGGNWRLLVYTTTSHTIPTVITVPQYVVNPAKLPNVIPLGGVVQKQDFSGTPRPTAQTTDRRPTSTYKTTYRPTYRTTPRHNNSPTPSKTCIKSQTEISHKTVCQGDRVFHETFRGNKLTNSWAPEIFMPSEPDYEFVVFHDDNHNLHVSNGKLYIKPTVFDDQMIRGGKLELANCSGHLYTEDCKREAQAFSILPPIKTARITTRNSFTFKYGKVQVRAKLPSGDWIIPEIWLEPARKVYGPFYASGKIRLAMARGNRDLVSSYGERLDNNQLECGILMGSERRTLLRSIKRESNEGWHQQFHNYTLIWTPDNFSFMIDGDEKNDLLPNNGRRLAEMIGFDRNDQRIWSNGSSLAPFDQEFYISLGLSIGGMKDFPDNCVSGGNSKPWRNEAVKAMLNFWEDRENWLPTWNDKSELQIEEISVFAL